ncbi:hypothetical protein IJ098_02950 [Candidatus Saccharibacteria bacterium]|nr:hypothetical protein [Candidatus Saccharibacteria bacterium]
MKKQTQPLNNHYWFKYKDVESKVVELSYMTHFDDNQLAVYSFHIADLMIQIASEYESVVVDLFQLCSTGNKKDSKLSEKLLYIAKEFELEKKELRVVHPNMYFEHRFNSFYAPFGYEDDGEDDIYKNYNSIKHHRTKNLKKANIKNLILALSALYILLLFYYSYAESEISAFQSSIFEAKTAGPAIGVMVDFGVPLADELEKCILFNHVWFDYYLFRENHFNGIDQLVDEAVSTIGMNRVSGIVKQYQQSTYAVIFNIIINVKPEISVGEAYDKTLMLTGNYYADESKYMYTKVNRGYGSIYIPLDKMKLKVDEIRKYKIADADMLYNM